jgi:hypothetical protein
VLGRFESCCAHPICAITPDRNFRLSPNAIRDSYQKGAPMRNRIQHESDAEAALDAMVEAHAERLEPVVMATGKTIEYTRQEDGLVILGFTDGTGLQISGHFIVLPYSHMPLERADVVIEGEATEVEEDMTHLERGLRGLPPA